MRINNALKGSRLEVGFEIDGAREGSLLVSVLFLSRLPCMGCVGFLRILFSSLYISFAVGYVMFGVCSCSVADARTSRVAHVKRALERCTSSISRQR